MLGTPDGEKYFWNQRPLPLSNSLSDTLTAAFSVKLKFIMCNCVETAAASFGFNESCDCYCSEVCLLGSGEATARPVTFPINTAWNKRPIINEVASFTSSSLKRFLCICLQSVEPAPPGLSCEPYSQHAGRGHQLHPPCPPTYPGLQTLLPHPQRPVR